MPCANITKTITNNTNKKIENPCTITKASLLATAFPNPTITKIFSNNDSTKSINITTRISLVIFIFQFPKKNRYFNLFLSILKKILKLKFINLKGNDQE